MLHAQPTFIVILNKLYHLLNVYKFLHVQINR